MAYIGKSYKDGKDIMVNQWYYDFEPEEQDQMQTDNFTELETILEEKEEFKAIKDYVTDMKGLLSENFMMDLGDCEWTRICNMAREKVGDELIKFICALWEYVMSQCGITLLDGGSWHDDLASIFE